MRGERISLHELTALRLDMTGERAQQPMPRSRKHASGSRDARGNIVASRSFKVRKRTLDVVEQEREHPEKPIEADTIEIQVKTKKRRRDNYIPDLLPFLHAPEMIEKAPQTVSNGLGNNDLPSSDLLKSICYFSSRYYDEQGVLTAASRKAKSNGRLREASRIDEDSDRDLESSETSEGQSDPSIDVRKIRLRSSTLTPRSRTLPEDRMQTRTSPLRRSAKSAPTVSNKSKDMFRAFDGSTLLLIGMLVQSHVVSRLNRAPPTLKDWDDQVCHDQRIADARSRRGRKKRSPQLGEVQETERDEEQSVSEILEDDEKDEGQENAIRHLMIEGDDSDEEKTDFDLTSGEGDSD